MQSLTESQRQFYLGAAGIRCWYARSPLPGAAASPEFEFDEPAAAALVPVDVQAAPLADSASVAASRERLTRLQALMGGAGASASAPEPVSVPQALPEPAEPVQAEAPADEVRAPAEAEMRENGAADAEQPNVHWGIWVAPGVVILGTLSEGASLRLQDTLAANILKALGGEPVQRHEIRWPVFGNARIAGNDRAGLVALLTGLAKEFSGRRLVVLGIPQVGEDWMGDVLPDVVVNFPISLAAMSTDPTAKRDLWHQLSSLPGIGRRR